MNISIPSQCRALILGCSGTSLTPQERAVYTKYSPFGLIVFSRNCKDRVQLIQLVRDFRDCVGWHAPVFIDQEGGHNQRLLGKAEGAIIGEEVGDITFEHTEWPAYPSMKRIGDLAQQNTEVGLHAAYLMGLALGAVLADVGITVNVAPVLDLLFSHTHAVIGDRAFGSNPYLVASLGRLLIQGLMATGTLPVTKHIPGHGRATTDSHKALPSVDVPFEQLYKDFFPFVYNNDVGMSMVAHIRYTALDDAPATQSKVILKQYIRDTLLVGGILISDCIFMEALSGTLTERAKACFDAGMDVVCASHGSPQDKRNIAEAAPILSERARSCYTHSRTRSLQMRQNTLRAGKYSITDYNAMHTQLMNCFTV